MEKREPQPEFAAYFEELYWFARSVRSACDEVLSARSMAETASMDDLHARVLDAVNVCGGIRRLIKQRGRNLRHDTATLHEYRKRRIRAVGSALHGLSTREILLAAEMRDAAEHFDERLDVLGLKGESESHFSPSSGGLVVADTNSLPQTEPLPISMRTYVVSTTEFLFAGHSINVHRLRDEAVAIIERLEDRRLA